MARPDSVPVAIFANNEVERRAMQVLFGILAFLAYVFGALIFTTAPSAIQEGLAILVFTNANIFLIAALWPTREPKPCGKGEIAGAPFVAFDDGTVLLTGGNGVKTRFPSFDLMERCFKEQAVTEQSPPVIFEGWGRR